MENEEDEGKTSPSLHRRNFLKFSIQNILSASARERQEDMEEDPEDDEEEERERRRESGVRIVRPLVSNWAGGGGGGGTSHYPPYSPLLSSLYNLTLPSLPSDNR